MRWPAKKSGWSRRSLGPRNKKIIAKVKSAYADYFMASKSVEIYKELLELVGYNVRPPRDCTRSAEPHSKMS